MTRYELYLNDAAGIFIKPLLNMESLEWVKVVNDVGTLTMRFDEGVFPWTDFTEDGRVEVYRCPDNDPNFLVGVYFLKMRRWERPNNISYVTLTGLDSNHILERRIIDAYEGSAGSAKSGAADSLMNAYVQQELGSGASADRTMTAQGVTIPAATSLGPSVAVEESHAYLIDALQDISALAAQKGTAVYFDMTATNARAFTFNTFSPYRGQYRGWNNTAPLEVSEDKGNLTNVVVVEDATAKATMAYVGGQGAGITRDVPAVGDATKRGINRIEAFQDAVRAKTLAELQDEARNLARQRRTRITFSGDIVSSNDFQYGVDWNLGDVVGVKVGTYQLDCAIQMVRGTVDSNGQETIKASIQYAG